jgi:hypothetical protein
MLKRNNGVDEECEMNFLRKIFFGGGVSNTSASVLTLYVRPKMCEQVVVLQINIKDQLSLNDDESGYFVRKVANHPRCPFEAEVMLYFDRNKNLTKREITGGAFVEESVYLDFLASTNQTTPTE